MTHRTTHRLCTVGTWVAWCVALVPSVAAAFDFNGNKRLVSVFRDGGTQPLGVVSFVSPPPSLSTWPSRSG